MERARIADRDGDEGSLRQRKRKLEQPRRVAERTQRRGEDRQPEEHSRHNIEQMLPESSQGGRR